MQAAVFQLVFIESRGELSFAMFNNQEYPYTVKHFTVLRAIDWRNRESFVGWRLTEEIIVSDEQSEGEAAIVRGACSIHIAAFRFCARSHVMWVFFLFCFV